MTLLIGTDEAGYGPNLGPLLISATAWQLPKSDATLELYDRLENIVRRDASSLQHIPIADSKKLYKPRGGLKNLERGLFAAFDACQLNVHRWQEAWQTLARKDSTQLQDIPWYSDYDLPLPIDLDEQQRADGRTTLINGLQAADVSLKHLGSTALFPARFNDLLDRYESKGSVLSLATLKLVQDVLAQYHDEDILIQCDKHGGRNRYLAVLQTVFPDERIRIICEGRGVSTYRWEASGSKIEIRFVAKGESFLPAALASMTSKYLRELAMKAFNTFWQQHQPDLKPTAGYPVDAKRFMQEIESVRRKLGLEKRMLWRAK